MLPVLHVPHASPHSECSFLLCSSTIATLNRQSIKILAIFLTYLSPDCECRFLLWICQLFIESAAISRSDNTCWISHSSGCWLGAISHSSDLCNAKETLKYAYAIVFLHFYINPSDRGKGKRGGVRVRVPVRGCCSDIFLTICISHTPWPGKRNENGGNDLLISEVCAHTYIHTYVLYEYVCVAVWSIDRNLNWYELCRAGECGQGERYEVWIGYGNGNECTWRVRVSASSTSYTALATYQKFLCGTIYDSCSVCVRVCPYVRVCVSVWKFMACSKIVCDVR